MLKMHDSTMRRSIGKFKTSAAGKTAIAGLAVVLAGVIFSALAFGQQSQKEYIYMGGKAVATESSAFTPPAIAITSPTTGSSYNTSVSSITVSGTASHSSGISAVTWMNNRGGSGNCTGTTSWNCRITNLLIGQDVLIITARNNANSFSTATLVVNYCTYSLSSSSASFASSGGTGTVSNTCVGGCSWTSNSNASWITVTSGSSGSGSGNVSYSVAANTSSARSGTITIAGQTFTINQANGCTYTLNPTYGAYPYYGGSGGFTVTNTSSCSWTATSSDTSWLTVTGGSSGVGNGTVTYSVAGNSSGSTRNGTISVGNASYSVYQNIFSCNSGCLGACIAATGNTGLCMSQCCQ